MHSPQKDSIEHKFNGILRVSNLGTDKSYNHSPFDNLSSQSIQLFLYNTEGILNSHFSWTGTTNRACQNRLPLCKELF